MRTLVIALGIIVNIIFFSCNKDDVINPEKPLLKTKYWYYTSNDTTPFKTTNYLYDNYKRLERINHCSGASDTEFIYELFEYNANNENVDKYTYDYANDSLGWFLQDSTHFVYENGKLILEVTYYPPPNSYQVSFLYEYDNSLLIRKYKYENHQFTRCTTYEYENGLCIKETIYQDTDLNIMDSYMIHYYDNELLIRSENYSSQDYLFQIIIYSYDPNGNLITEESLKTDFPVVKPLEYFYRYEYY